MRPFEDRRYSITAIMYAMAKELDMSMQMAATKLVTTSCRTPQEEDQALAEAATSAMQFAYNTVARIESVLLGVQCACGPCTRENGLPARYPRTPEAYAAITRRLAELEDDVIPGDAVPGDIALDQFDQMIADAMAKREKGDPKP